jgi:hypothetical protein
MSAVRKRNALAAREGPLAPAYHNSMQMEHVATATLVANGDSARRFSKLDENAARQIVEAQGVRLPLLVKDNVVKVGDVLLQAARRLGIETVPVIRIDDLTPVQADMLAVGYQRLGELGEWDRAKLVELHLRFEVEVPDYRPEQIGFEVGAMDFMLAAEKETAADEETEQEDLDGLSSEVPISRVGDVWRMGKHRLICGDSTDASTFDTLMQGASAAAVFSDPPFGCPIDGFVAGKGRHREFVMGSGGMAPDELRGFFTSFITNMRSHLKSGAVVELVIDWRSLHLLLQSAEPLLGPLLNLAVWVKDRPGQGSFLRSQHELVLIFRHGKGKYRNNVQGGRHGRNRSNVWRYPSAKTASTGSDEGDMLKHHPTPKSVRMVADALLDCTRRGDIVIDAFLGSGTTLIAAEKVGRTCYGVELDPLYADLIVRRWQAWSGEEARLEADARTFAEVSADRAAAA